MFDVSCFSLEFDTDIKEFVFNKSIVSIKDVDDYSNTGVLPDGSSLVLDRVVIKHSSSCFYNTIHLSEDEDVIYTKLRDALGKYNADMIRRSTSIISALR